MRRFKFAYKLCGMHSYQVLQKNILRQWKLYIHVESRGMCVASRSGVSDYEKERLTHKVILPQKFNFATDVLDQWAMKEKNGIRSTSIPAFWLVYEDGKEYKLNFQELQKQTKRMANILENQCGIKRGDTTIIMLPKIPEFWLVNIASIRIGFISSPATMMLTSKDLSYRFSALKPSSVIAHESVADVVDAAEDLCPGVKQKIIVSSSPTRRKGWIDLNRLQSESDDHKCADTDKDETMLIFFTSGTTGHPKMVEHTHSSYGKGLDTLGRYYHDVSMNNIVWNMSDTGWAKTAMASFFGPWSHGTCVFIHQMARFSPKVTLEVLSKYPIDTLCAPPLVYRALLQENLSDFKFKKLEHCCSGGEALTAEVIKQWISATGMKVYECYGQTETRVLASTMKCLKYKAGSFGKAVPGVDLSIVDENENELPAGEIGEIVVKRKTLQVGIFKGYKNDPEQTKKALTENYFHTGDKGYCDEDGFYWFVARNDDVINSAGYRIGPHEVESALLNHPAVVEVAVVSSPDSKRGEVVKAFIALKDSVKGSNELIKEIQDHCKKITAPYKYPRKIEFVEDLPKTASGKIKRSELKRKEWSNLEK